VSDETVFTRGGRHSGREVALQVLYAIDVGTVEADRDAADVEGTGVDAERVFEQVTEHFVVPRSAVVFARELAVGVFDRVRELDEILGAHARNWRVSRMAVVDRNVLRLAVYELRDTDTPVAVVIDEAVDLARRFGSDSSPAFVNGVLDAVARELRAA
jgi:N utilization substance protein B